MARNKYEEQNDKILFKKKKPYQKIKSFGIKMNQKSMRTLTYPLLPLNLVAK